MSEADKIIESLKNSGKKVEEFYMSNKTSNKNVANVGEDVKILTELIQDIQLNFEGGIENRLKDFEIKALQNILAEREQKDKRIKELEEERDHWHGCFIVAMENSIAKEKVINLVENETIDISGFECIAVEDLQELLEGEEVKNVK